LHCCASGLRDDQKQLAVKKPLRIETTCSELAGALKEFQCKCETTHAPCEGRITKYLKSTLTRAIHLAFCQRAVNFRCSSMVGMLTLYSAHDDEGAIPSLAATASHDALSTIKDLVHSTASDSRELAYATAALCDEYGPETARSQTHRAIQEDILDRTWCAMVTTKKTLYPRDPESQCPEALKATDNKLLALRAKKVWNEDKVME
jgi:hypothetical protein